MIVCGTPLSDLLYVISPLFELPLQMLEYYEEAKAAGVRVSGLWIQDWSGNIYTQFGKRVYWDWVWNQQHYPGQSASIIPLRLTPIFHWILGLR